MAHGYLLILIFCASLRIAAQPGKIDTDRPDQTESAGIVPPHYFQGEFGFNKENAADRNYDLIHPTGLLKYGLKKMEFRLEFTVKSSYEHLIPNPKWTRGLEPVNVGIKAAICQEKKIIPKTSVILHVGLPGLASPVFRTDRLAPGFRFTMQHTLSAKSALSYNLGAEWDGFSKDPDWLYTLSPGFDLTDKWYAYLEVFGFLRRGAAPQHNLAGGIAYYISRNVKADLSGGFSITKIHGNYVAVGFSFRFNTAGKPRVSSSSGHSAGFAQSSAASFVSTCGSCRR